MLKLTIKGEPKEIASFIDQIEDIEGFDLRWSSGISKRAAHHKWGSCKAGLQVETIPDIDIDVTIYSRKQPTANKKEGYVYLMPAWGKTGLIGYKIGKTRNPLSRRKTFSVKFNFPVEFLALISTDDYSKLESDLHMKYRDKRRGASEFFDLTQEQVAEIVALMSEGDQASLKYTNKEMSYE